ncbi:MAG: signal recognition particle protein Srp54 [Candidatus Bathyarchaeia archaeon]|nr:signal recognition particle protein Srp54 [Candidatus Bathyarchaeota archaeon]
MSVLENLGRSLSDSIKRLLRLPIVDEKAVKELVKDLQRALLRADVDLNLVLEISERVEERALKEKLPPGISKREHVVKVLYEELTRMMGEKPARVDIPRISPYILMLIGIQGSGKTVTAVKIARFYQKRGVRPAIICADTYRPGAFEQLDQLASRINVPVYWKRDGSPVEIVREGVREYTSQRYNLIIVDTAGRHKDEKELIEEMKMLEREVEPHEVMLILDGAIGQQAYRHAEAFHNATKIGSITVTKLDGSTKGGGALSAVAATGASLKFIGTGEDLDDLEPFDPPKFVGRILGMGDIEGLIQRVKEAEITLSNVKARRMMEGKFTLRDLYEQVESLRKLGPLKKIWSMIPGTVNIPEEYMASAEKRIEDWGIIIQSMTKEEVEDPKILNSSRIRRIARGSGKPERVVKEMINQYFAARRMMKGLKRKSLLRKPPWAPTP